MEPLCWLEGQVIPADRARISVLDHGLLYGDGVFEGIRFYHGRPFRLHAHLQRLYDSARAIALRIPYSMEELSDATESLVGHCSVANGYLRLVVTRGSGTLGLDPSRCARPTVFIVASPLRLAEDEAVRDGLRVIVASTRRLPMDGLDPRIKSLNYLNHVLARIEANAADADEAILLNGQGRVAEGSAENVFVVRRGELLTPRLCDGALDGVTRQIVLEAAAQAGIPAREAAFGPYDLYTAEECFLTGTGAEMLPVREVDGRPLQRCPGPIFGALRAAFQEVVERETRI